MEEFFENELARQFEEMIENNEERYFDTGDLEEIIIHYLELGDISFAEMAVNYGLQLHPHSIDIKTKKLEVLLELQRYTDAKKLIKELQSIGLETTDFLVCCAKYYSVHGNSKRAIEYCEKALSFNEEENFLHNFIADEYVNLDDPFNALKHYQLALKNDPQDDYALENTILCFNKLNKNEEALEFITHYIEEFPFSETAWFELGQFHFNRKNYEEAIRAFDYLLAINSESVGVYANKAACYEALKDWDNAILVYFEMLEMEYTKAYTYYRIGLCHKENQQPILAMKAFQQSLREDPQFYLSMMEQSYLYEEMGRMYEALHFAKEATSLNEDNLDYQKRLAFLYIDAQQFEESLECLKKLVEAEPNRFYNWYAYSEVLMLVEHYQEAVTVLNDALKIHNRAELFYQLSNAYFNLGKRLEARENLAIALTMEPQLAQDMLQKYPFIKDEVKGTKTKKRKEN